MSLVDGILKEKGMELVGKESTYQPTSPISNNQKKSSMCNEKTKVVSTIKTLTFRWVIPEDSGNVTLGFANAIGNSVVSGALPAGFIPAQVVGSFDADMLRNMLGVSRMMIDQFNYVCKDDETQLDNPIKIDESSQDTSSNIHRIEVSAERRNSENVTYIQTIFQKAELNIFRSLKIGATSFPAGEGSKTVDLTVRITGWKPYGELVEMSEKNCNA